jgi:hypothetical protein
MKSKEDGWKSVWGFWVLYFGVAEYIALKSKHPKAPFSYFMRHALGVRHKPLTQRAGQMALGAGIVWLISHLYENQGDDALS